jgi:purine-nucleoside phosphorylase
VAKNIAEAVAIPYSDIPGFVETTAATHAGQLLIGRVAGTPVAAMEGRIHYYEGYSLEQVTFPVRVMRGLGASSLIVTNACGCLNPQFRKGDLLIIDDHLNLMGVNPLIGPNDDGLGPRFPDMCRPYSPEYADLALEIARENGIAAHRGVYSAMTGPSLETRAEYRMLRILGADAIGMSTVPEVIVAVHAGLKTLGLAVLTDICLPDALEPCRIESIVAVANSAGPGMAKIILDFLARAGGKGIL